MSEIVVRQAMLEDVPELLEMRRAFTVEGFPGDPRPGYETEFTAVVGDGLRDGSWIVWVGEIAGKIVAHAFVAMIPKVPRPVEAPRHLGYLTNVYTRPSYRGQGIGGRVLDAVTAWAQTEGGELLVVWPSEGSISLYNRHGFVSHDEPLVWTNPNV